MLDPTKRSCEDSISGTILWESLTVSEWKRVVVLLLVVLAGSVYHNHSLIQLRRIFGATEVNVVEKKLEDALRELQKLKQEHEFVVERLQNMRRSVGPFVDYEITRRRIQSGTKEIWLYFNYYFEQAMNESVVKAEFKTAILKELAERKRSLLSDLEKLPTVDGYQSWRHNEAGSVSDLVQRRLRFLQNPTDCRNANKILCEVSTCGLGCQQHHLAYCLIYAYATGRTLILKSYNWKNLAENKMQAQLFHQFSNTCNDVYNDSVRPWSAASFNSKVLFLPTLYDLRQPVLPKYLPIYIPRDLAWRIGRFTADPGAWWVGQMLKYILKPKKEAQRIIHENLLAIDFKSPTVGVHIRRTDKIEMEAKKFDIEEYMTHVEDFFDKVEQYSHVSQRRVYIATDEPEVIGEATARYPGYKFYGNHTIALWAGLDSRMYPEAMLGTLLDIHMLAICDYVVCTFSSNIGRMVYELVQTYRLDANTGFTSLDRYYYFTHGEPHLRRAVMNNNNLHSLHLQIGDVIKLDNQDLNCSGVNLRSHANGPFPWYKTIPLTATYPFPEYDMVQIFSDKRLP